MRYSLKVITPPVDYPVDPDDMLNFLKIDSSNPGLIQEKQFVEDLIGAATSMLEEYTGRAFITQTLEMILTPSLQVIPSLAGLSYAYDLLPDVIKIWRPPCQSITSINAIEPSGSSGIAHLQAASNYTVNLNAEPAEVQPIYGGTWEWYVNGYYKIRYIAGYGATLDKIPPQIRQAIRLTVATWYKAREDLDYSIPPHAIELLKDIKIEAGDL